MSPFISMIMFTFQVLFQLNDNEHEMRLNERSTLALELTLSVYIEHKYDIIDKLELVIHRQKNDYHPKAHDNVTVEMFLECPHVNRDKSHTRSDE
jgi:hypothetical protein